VQFRTTKPDVEDGVALDAELDFVSEPVIPTDANLVSFLYVLNLYSKVKSYDKEKNHFECLPLENIVLKNCYPVKVKGGNYQCMLLSREVWSAYQNIL
jgi:hypothetical protein